MATITNEQYIEALDTLIEYYQGKISELEEIKKGLLVKQMQEEVTVCLPDTTKVVLDKDKILGVGLKRRLRIR